MACAGRALTSIAHVFNELLDAWYLLGRPADTTQPPRAQRPAPHVVTPRILVRSYDHPVLHAAGGVHQVSSGASRLLDNVLLLGAVLYATWGYTVRVRLVKDDIPAEAPAAICRRIVIGQALYALGASLCTFNSYLSIAFIVLVQINFAIAPRFRAPSRL